MKTSNPLNGDATPSEKSGITNDLKLSPEDTINFDLPKIIKKLDSALLGKKYTYTDPVSWYNNNKVDHAKELLIDKAHWSLLSTDENKNESWQGNCDEGVSAIFKADGVLKVNSDNATPFTENNSYTPFNVV